MPNITLPLAAIWNLLLLKPKEGFVLTLTKLLSKERNKIMAGGGGGEIHMRMDIHYSVSSIH